MAIRQCYDWGEHPPIPRLVLHTGTNEKGKIMATVENTEGSAHREDRRAFRRVKRALPLAMPRPRRRPRLLAIPRSQGLPRLRRGY